MYHPAAHDDGLRMALQDLRTGRWMSMRKLLAGTECWTLWTARTQVLAAAAAGSTVVQAWREEEPESTAALVMHTRVSVERTLRAHRTGHPRTAELAHEAWQACRVAVREAPADPVPWVCLLALAQVDRRRASAECATRPPEPLLPTGPWGLLEQADRRDPCNREAYHRMLQCLKTWSGDGRTDSVHFVRWVVSWAPRGASLLALPLYVSADLYRAQRRRAPGRALELHWITEHAVGDAERALHCWFDHADRATRSPLDLNYLAHALWAARLYDGAARVFEELGPYATPLPWAYRTGDPDRPELAEEEFLRARERCLAAATGTAGGRAPGRTPANGGSGGSGGSGEGEGEGASADGSGGGVGGSEGGRAAHADSGPGRGSEDAGDDAADAAEDADGSYGPYSPYEPHRARGPLGAPGRAGPRGPYGSVVPPPRVPTP
ncbi:hypothetical protein RKE29_07350 [Streptomyces sp. B1866]|uniref:hypothetical protein n=1 Tax=Streptomyces sp. B1866 TaxID=3075431 RepID=UPI002891A461|nr:hypothetical protein [Streptomyces sp. B1866]MDT3396458.1 hypothetical protein [Streptomyces sp. B1866]